MTHHMAGVLAAAKNSDLVKALARGTAAQMAMAAAEDPGSYSDAASSLSAAFDEIKLDILASYPHLAHAVEMHTAKLTGRS